MGLADDQVEAASSELYGIAVAMHESIRDGKGATGWDDARVTTILRRLQAERDSDWTRSTMGLVIGQKVLADAMRQIERMSWDSGSIPAPEVVSRIYCIARNALLPLADSEPAARGER